MTESTWAPFDSFREMKVVENGRILVIRPSDATTVVPLFCSMCHFPMRTSDDSIAYRKQGCCDKCLLVCRGDKTQIPEAQWEEYLKERHILARPIINLK